MEGLSALCDLQRSHSLPKSAEKITAKNMIVVRHSEQEGVRHTQQIALKQKLSKTLLNFFLASFSKEIRLSRTHSPPPSSLTTLPIIF